MVNIVNYIIESGVSLALLTSIYVLLLRKETFFMQNRLFLLLSITFSVILPFVKIPISVTDGPVMLPEVNVIVGSNFIDTINVYGHEVSAGIDRAVQTSNIILIIYFTGLLFFLSRFVIRIVKVLHLIRKSEVRQKERYKLVLVDDDFSPFSFFDYIFVSREFGDDHSAERMLMHELEHVKQGHSVDVLLLEILIVFQWFNPFLWLLKMIVRENHEFLADRAVISKGVSVGTYKQLLLNQVVGQQYLIANSFNYSLIKKRIMMMSRIKSSIELTPFFK